MADNNIGLDLSAFANLDKKPIAPDNTSEQFYRGDPVKTQTPSTRPSVMDGFNETLLKNAQEIGPSPTISKSYPKDLTEKYKGTAAYSPWMDPTADNESTAAKNWSTWDAIGTGLSGMLDNALYAGKQYAMFYPRLGRAIVSLDASLLNPNEAEIAAAGEEQKRISKQNPIFYDPGSEDDIFSKQFLSETLQSTGFTFGTMGAFVAENAIFGGMGKVLPKLFKIGAANSSMRLAEIGDEAINLGKGELSLTEQTKNLLQNGPAGRLGSKTLWDKALAAGSKLPFLDGLADAGKLMQIGAKSGLTTGELTMIGLGGLRRGVSEWNFASSEAVVESGGVYGETYDMLYDKYQKAGIEVTPEIQDQIRKDAMSAATKDYAVNVAILGITNKIMFTNLFRSFGTDSKFINLLTKEGERTLSVMGETEGGKMLAKSLPKSFLGVLGNRKDIIEKFGKQVYRKELGKDLIRGLSKFEINEGIQENLQEGTSVAIKKYYSDLYDKDVASWGDSFAEGVSSQFNKKGLKTFLSGALMGFFTRPITGAIQTAKESFDEYREKRANPNHVNSLKSTLNELNTFYQDPKKVLYEPIKAIKEQVTFNTQMAKASAQGQKYDYFNNKDSAIIKLALYAKNTGTFDTFKDFIKGYGSNFSEKEFKEATGIDIKDTKYNSVQEYTNELAETLDRYGELHDKYTDMYSNHLSLETLTSDPYRKQRYAFNQMALKNAIHTVAFNEAKAQASTIRAADISRKVSQVEGIGNAAASTFNNITSYSKSQDSLRILENELKILKETPGKDDVTKQAIKDKQEEIKLLKDWNSSAYEEVVDKENEDEKTYLPFNVRALSEASKDKLVETLTKYYQLKNKQNGITAPIKIQDVKKILNDVNDYQKLTDDTKDYIDAVNLLSDPNKFVKFAINHRSALVAAFARTAHDTYKELESQSGLFEEYIKNNPADLEQLLSIAKSPFNAYDSMDTVLKAIDNINKLAIDQNKKTQEENEIKQKEILEELEKKAAEAAERIKQYEEDKRRAAGQNLAIFSTEEQNDFILSHYDYSDDEKYMERFFTSVKNNEKVVTDKIPISKIVKSFKKASENDLTDDDLYGYLIQYEQALWASENPTQAKAQTNSAQRAATTTTVVKKIKNLVGQKVSVKGRKGTIIVEDDTYYVKFDDNASLQVPLGNVEEGPTVFNWKTDLATGAMVAYETNPEDFITLDDYPEITLLDDNLTEEEQEITGVTRNSKTVRIQDISHNVEYIDNDTIKIDGKDFTVVREDSGEIVQLTHKKGKRNIIFTKNDMYNDPTGLAAEHISLAEQFFLQHTPASDISNEEYDAMLQQVENEGDPEEDIIVGSRRIKGKKTPSALERDLQIEEIMFDMTDEQYQIFDQIFQAVDNTALDKLSTEDKENIKNWALDTIKKLSKLDALEPIAFLTDLIINPLSKSNNEFNNRDNSTKRVNKKKNKANDGTKKAEPSTGEQGSESEIQGGSITGAAGEVEGMYNKKEVKVKIDDLVSTEPTSIYTQEETAEAKRMYKFSKKSYKQNLSKTEKPETDPFEDSDLLTCFN